MLSYKHIVSSCLFSSLILSTACFAYAPAPINLIGVGSYTDKDITPDNLNLANHSTIFHFDAQKNEMIPTLLDKAELLYDVSCSGQTCVAVGENDSKSFDPAGRTLAAYRSTDGGESWLPISQSLLDIRIDAAYLAKVVCAGSPHAVNCNAIVARSAIDPWATGYDGNYDKTAIFHSGDGGATWVRAMMHQKEFIQAVNCNGDKGLSCIAVGAKYFAPNQLTQGWVKTFVMLSHNGGDSWSKPTFITTPEPTRTFTPQAVECAGKNNCAIVGKEEDHNTFYAAYFSHDGGKTWAKSHTNIDPNPIGYSESRQLSHVSCGGKHNNICLATGSESVYDGHYSFFKNLIVKSTDGGQTWLVLKGNQLPPTDIILRSVHCTADETPIFAISAYDDDRTNGVWTYTYLTYISKDGGATWSEPAKLTKTTTQGGYALGGITLQ